MPKKEDDINADMEAVIGRGQSVTAMGPFFIAESSRHRTALTDLAVELSGKSAGFRRSLPSE